MQDFIHDRLEERGVKVVIDYQGEFEDLQDKKEFSNLLKFQISEAIRQVLVVRQYSHN